jgi:L-ascorbate metabolism protein UlaG (beta-lactamase superfamily)
MILTYYGASFFRVQFGDVTLSFNPISKQSSFKQSKFGSDICFISNIHPDTAGVENAAVGDKRPFIISAPGEYEIGGIYAKGFETKTAYGGAEKINAVYSVTLEEMNLVFLGALSHVDLSPEVLEGLGEPNILFVPIGGQGTLSPSEAYRFSLKLEANIIIPMLYDTETLKAFQSEEGESDTQAVDKITIKKKDVQEREGDIIVLRSQA